MRSRLLFVLSLIVALLLVPGVARAGGAALDFPKDTYRPGEVAVGRTWFGHGTVATDFDHIEENGPWYVYLSAVDAPRPPTWPSHAENATRVGRLLFDRVTSDRVWVRVQFKVPLVPAGDYNIDFCNAACDPLGEFIGGWIHVAASPLENLMAGRLEDLESRVVAGREAQLEHLRTATRESNLLRHRIELLETADSGAPAWFGIGAGSTLLALGAWRLLVERRRRRELRELLNDADSPAEAVPFELEPAN